MTYKELDKQAEQHADTLQGKVVEAVLAAKPPVRAAPDDIEVFYNVYILKDGTKQSVLAHRCFWRHPNGIRGGECTMLFGDPPNAAQIDRILISKA